MSKYSYSRTYSTHLLTYPLTPYSYPSQALKKLRGGTDGTQVLMSEKEKAYLHGRVAKQAAGGAEVATVQSTVEAVVEVRQQEKAALTHLLTYTYLPTYIPAYLLYFTHLLVHRCGSKRRQLWK